MNNAQFVSFSASHDLNQVPAGETFTVTWRMKNTGDRHWGGKYRLVHINEDQGSTLMAAKSKFKVKDVASIRKVQPGQEVDITLTMTAPAVEDRRFFTDWQLRDKDKKLFGDVMWFRVVTVAPPIKDPIGFHESNSKYLEDHTIPDGTTMEEGTSFLKQWLVRNTGDRKWNEGYRLIFVNGDSNMAGSFSHRVPEAEPGDEVILSINMVAPPQRDDPYISSWRIHDDRNIPFGDPFWVKMFSTPKVEGFGIKPYSQNDWRWRNQKLGHGTQTFSEFGCLLTCFSMMLSGFGENYNPLQLNNNIKNMQSNGFNGSEVFFLAPALLIGHVKYWGNYRSKKNTNIPHSFYDPNITNKIDEYLARGDAAIVQVDKDPTDPYNFNVEQHWVLVLARQGDDYLVLDPIDGKPVSLLSKYGRQTRPQNAEDALKDAIQSALFYRSTKNADQGEHKEGGGSQIGPEELVYTGPKWQFDRCLIGLHDRANRHPQPADHAIARGKFESIKVQSGVTVAEMKGYKAKFYLCRLFESWNGRHLSVNKFIEAVSPDIAPLIANGVEYFEFHNEPNLTHEGLKAAGVKGSWKNGSEFAEYFIKAQERLKRKFPDIKIGFPGLSPGPDAHYQFGHDRGFRMNDTKFLQGADAALQAADFICVHAYYLTMEEVGTAIEQVKEFRRRFPKKLIFVSEFSNPDPQKNISAEDKGKQAKEFYKLCGEIPGVAAAYYFIVSGSGWDHQALRRDSNGRSTGIIEKIF